jgi:phosphatidylserine decarboxylase
VALRKGDEMGRFLLGSTVVLLFRKGAIRFDRRGSRAVRSRVGQPMAELAGR